MFNGLFSLLEYIFPNYPAGEVRVFVTKSRCDKIYFKICRCHCLLGTKDIANRGRNTHTHDIDLTVNLNGGVQLSSIIWTIVCDDHRQYLCGYAIVLPYHIINMIDGDFQMA